MTTETMTSTATYGQALGSTVNQFLFTYGIKRDELGAALGCSGANMSNRIHGRIAWPAVDLALLAHIFGVSTDSLSPAMIDADHWIPATFIPGAGSPVEVVRERLEALINAKKADSLAESRPSDGTPSGTRTLDPQIKSLLL